MQSDKLTTIDNTYISFARKPQGASPAFTQKNSRAILTTIRSKNSPKDDKQKKACTIMIQTFTFIILFLRRLLSVHAGD